MFLSIQTGRPVGACTHLHSNREGEIHGDCLTSALHTELFPTDRGTLLSDTMATATLFRKSLNAVKMSAPSRYLCFTLTGDNFCSRDMVPLLSTGCKTYCF